MRVDEHIDDSCDCTSDLWMEEVSEEKCARPLMIVSLNACRTGDCVDKVNGYTCDCDEDHELMLQVNGSACVARNVNISLVRRGVKEFPDVVRVVKKHESSRARRAQRRA